MMDLVKVFEKVYASASRSEESTSVRGTFWNGYERVGLDEEMYIAAVLLVGEVMSQRRVVVEALADCAWVV